MILAIDVGNSNIVLGGNDNEKIYFTVRLSTDRFKSNDEYAVLIKNLIELNGYDPADMGGEHHFHGGPRAWPRPCGLLWRRSQGNPAWWLAAA